jgi:tetratricopeptide (TPR) repeat protein
VQEALAYGEQSLAIARELNLREQMAFTLNDLTDIYWESGNTAQAQAVQIEARDLWRELGNLPMLADNLARSTQFSLVAGDYAALIAASDEAYAISRSIGNVWGQSNSRMLIGYAYWDIGEYGIGMTVMEEAIQFAEEVGHTIARVAIGSVLAQLYGALGAVAYGLELAEAAVAHAREKMPNRIPAALTTLARLHFLKGDLSTADAICRTVEDQVVDVNPQWVTYVSLFWLTHTVAEIALARADYIRATTLADQMIADNQSAGYRSFVPDVLHFKGKVMLAQDQIDLARPVLEEARAQAEAIGSRRSLWPILMALSEVEARGGDRTRAEELHRQAREIVEYIADHIADPAHPLHGPVTPDQLRASFLNLPDVRAARGL